MPLIDSLGILGVAASVFALVYAIRAFNATKDQVKDNQLQLKQRVYHDLMSEYRSEQMGNALKELGDIAAANRGKEKLAIAQNYRSILAANHGLAIPYRLVMQWYYEAALATEDKFIAELFYRVWDKGALSIIPNLIIPHETYKEYVILPVSQTLPPIEYVPQEKTLGALVL